LRHNFKTHHRNPDLQMLRPLRFDRQFVPALRGFGQSIPRSRLSANFIDCGGNALPLQFYHLLFCIVVITFPNFYTA
jgi:hypothetical protein